MSVSIRDLDTTTADFAEGTLTDVVAVNDGLELEKGKLDDYSTDPLTNNRFTGLQGTWSYDSTNQWLEQTDSTTAQHFGAQTGFAFDTKVDFEFDMKIESDPSGRIHSGAFIQTVAGEITGYRITHLDNRWAFSKWDLGSETSLNQTSHNTNAITVGQDVHIRVIHDFVKNTGELYVNDSLTISWSDSSYSQGRPGYHSYGNITHYDNLVANNLIKVNTGTRQSPQLDLSAVNDVASSSISWTETLNSQTITIETSIDGGSTWDTCTNGGSIPNISGANTLDVRQTLSTTDTTLTPVLESLEVDIDTAVVNEDTGVLQETETHTFYPFKFNDTGTLGSTEDNSPLMVSQQDSGYFNADAENFYTMVFESFDEGKLISDIEYNQEGWITNPKNTSQWKKIDENKENLWTKVEKNTANWKKVGGE